MYHNLLYFDQDSQITETYNSPPFFSLIFNFCIILIISTYYFLSFYLFIIQSTQFSNTQSLNLANLIYSYTKSLFSSDSSITKYRMFLNLLGMQICISMQYYPSRYNWIFFCQSKRSKSYYQLQRIVCFYWRYFSQLASEDRQRMFLVRNRRKNMFFTVFILQVSNFILSKKMRLETLMVQCDIFLQREPIETGYKFSNISIYSSSKYLQSYCKLSQSQIITIQNLLDFSSSRSHELYLSISINSQAKKTFPKTDSSKYFITILISFALATLTVARVTKSCTFNRMNILDRQILLFDLVLIQ